MKTKQNSSLLSPVRLSGKTPEPVISLERFYEQINKSPPCRAKIHKLPQKSGVNQAELFNPAQDVWGLHVIFLQLRAEGDVEWQLDLAFAVIA